MPEFVDRFSKEYALLFRTESASRSYLNLLVQEMRTLAARRGIELSGDRIARQGFVALLSEAHAAKGAFNVNAFNQFCSYLAPFFTSDLYEALLAAPSAWREGDGFQLRAILEYCPEALDIPVFSGQRRYRLDAARTSMIADAPTRRMRYVRRVRQALSAVSPRRRPTEASIDPGYVDRTATLYLEAGLLATLNHEHPSLSIDPQAFEKRPTRPPPIRPRDRRRLPIDRRRDRPLVNARRGPWSRPSFRSGANARPKADAWAFVGAAPA